MKPNTLFPTNEFYDKYSSQIRPIKIHLPKSKRDGKYFDFVGREKLMERLYTWLTNNMSTGSYLVTGFRGMGKTILVNRVMERLTRDINNKKELICLVSLFSLIIAVFLIGLYHCFSFSKDCLYYAAPLFLVSVGILIPFLLLDPRRFRISASINRMRFPHGNLFDRYHVDKLVRGKEIDKTKKSYSNIKVSINLGHEIMNERDILSMIAQEVKEKYTKFVKSVSPHFLAVYISVLLVSVIGIICVKHFDDLVKATAKNHENRVVFVQDIRVPSSSQENTQLSEISNQQGVTIQSQDSWLGRCATWVVNFFTEVYRNYRALALLAYYSAAELLLWWIAKKLLLLIPMLSMPQKAIRRLARLEERIVATTDEESGSATAGDRNILSLSVFGRRKKKVYPIADVREIETELSDIINTISVKECIKEYRARFFVVFDEMDKIDPEMMDMSKNISMPEYIDSVKGFPDGMSSRERRRNVLKLLANIKLFITTAKAKFVFISGRELYDAYLADLSDRDFAISSIFTGVINVDSFLTPEGGQTDVRSMSEWYIANRLLPEEWLRMKERENAADNLTLKKEMPSLKWFYEYLITECRDNGNDAAYIIGFLHIFAAYLTHISNGSPKKIFLYFDKYLMKDVDCSPYINWSDVCEVGNRHNDTKKCRSHGTSWVLWFDQIQQKTINLVYYLANPIMGTITNDLSNYGDRFLVTLSFVIDHIYKHHNRSFSWRNLEQIPDLLKTSKAPELREAMTSILEHMAQTHVSPILIGLNEYKFRKSISEEISVMSKLSEEASAIFNFTLDESLAVIQHNTLLLNYYIQLEQKEMSPSDKDKNRRFQPIIARIHSNLGDLHYWDEDYYKASLEYRAAIEAFDDNDNQGFLTKIRCMLKLGLTYESRKLYPNAYQMYCKLTSLLIEKRWVDERTLGLDVVETRTDGWREKRTVLVDPMVRADKDIEDVRNYKYSPSTIPSKSSSQEKYYLDYRKHFKQFLLEGDGKLNVEYSTNVDGVVSSFVRNLTSEKAKFVSTLSLFEEIRYVYQVILAKLSILEKMGMSGITQTNIDVAEGEFRSLYKSANFKEKFIISSDFFRKLAEILYYKNSLAIISQNQDSFYASLYFADYDILANLDDYCRYAYNIESHHESNALKIKRDVRFFFNCLNNSISEKKDEPRFENISNSGTLEGILKDLLEKLDEYVELLPFDKAQYDYDKDEMKEHVRGYLVYNMRVVFRRKERYPRIDLRRVNYCDFHRQELRKRNLRPPCYACKYYVRSLSILAENMFVDKGKNLDLPNRAYQILRLSFKSELLYTRTIHVNTLAQTIEGLANVLFSCSSGDRNEIPSERTHRGLSPEMIQMLYELCTNSIDKNEHKIIDGYQTEFSQRGTLSRLDKSVLFYFSAYRFYVIGTSYGDAVRCLNKIITVLAYYLEVVNYNKKDDDYMWGDESDAIVKLIGEEDFEKSFVSSLFTLIVRYNGYMYDLTNLTEINEMKLIFSRQFGRDVDLSKLSLYPNVRSSFLRILEILTKGIRYLSRKRPNIRSLADYQDHVKQFYPLIAPYRRYETTFNEEVLGFYTKLRFNDHILNNILIGNPMLEAGAMHSGNATYHILFYRKIADYLSIQHPADRLDQTMFNVGKNSQKKLDLIEFLIHDSLVCLANMTQVFTPHNHLTSYSKSFIGVVYNYFWEWSRKYEFLISLYKYSEERHSSPVEAEKIVDRICKGIRVDNKTETKNQLLESMNRCCDHIEVETNTPFGKRSTRLFEKLRHDIDDITINTIYSNYTAEMAINYFNMSEEFNTEGDAYKDMISMMHFLDDDFNNDTCQFHIACDRFLLNTNIVQTQRAKLEVLYCNSNVYNFKKGYIDGPASLYDERNRNEERFDESLFINSEY